MSNDPLHALVGKTVTRIRRSEDLLIFYTQEGPVYVMHHDQDCCENVIIEDIEGDLEDLLGLIVQAETCSSGFEQALRVAAPEKLKSEVGADSFTWTFYRISSNKGGVVIRWFGESNGYYSESVDFHEAGSDEWGVPDLKTLEQVNMTEIPATA